MEGVTVDKRALMTEMFASTSFVNDYVGQPLPVVQGEDEDGDPLPLVAAPDVNPTNKDFELLHPRDRKGRWIEKGGTVKIFPRGGGSPIIGTVDAVALDGSVNVTLKDGSKANAQPGQLEQLNEVARLDSPGSPLPVADPAENGPRLQANDKVEIPDLRDEGDTYDGGPTGDFDADSKRVEGLIAKYAADGFDTETLHDKVDGKPWKFRRDREKAHEKIIAEFLDSPSVKKDRKILIMGGMPGAGKTTFLNSPAGQQALGVNLDDYVMVNPDTVKTRMIEMGLAPDYPGLTPDEAAALIHNESSQIAWLIMHRALGQDKNIAYDATLRNAIQAEELLRPAKDREPPSHDTTMVMIDVDVDHAVARAIDRYNSGDRYIPPSFIHKMRHKQHGSSPRASYEQAKTYVDRSILVDNRDFAAGPKILEDQAQPDALPSTPPAAP